MSSATDLHYLSASDAVGLFRRRELSPRELMEAVIARAERVEPTINAFTDTFFEAALEAASAAADAYARGANRPLEGLALAVKDEVHIEGQRATEGSLLFADQVADGTDPFAQRLLDAGAIVHARTTTPEFSMAAVTWSLLHGVTRNPWNPDFTCGGSSGGSGASLAAGSCTLATGSDIAGSIRIPSSLNGLVGFKPPWGRVPEVWPWNRDAYAASGPLARTVNDSALFENAMAGPLETDMFALEPCRLPEPVPPGRGMRVAVSADLGYFDVSAEVAEALTGAVAALAAAGIECEPVELDWTAQASRRGFFDGVGIRLPTVSVRPGAPNAAASGFFSGIIREPLAGLPAKLPVSRDVRHPHASPRTAAGFLIHAAELDTSRLGGRPNLTMPGVSVTVGEQMEALGRVAGPDAVALITEAPDPTIAEIVAGWPARFDTTRATSLGFVAEETYDDIIRTYIEDDLP